MCFAVADDLLAVGYEDEYAQVYRVSPSGGPATEVHENIKNDIAAQVNCLCFYRYKGRLRLIVCQNTLQGSMLGAYTVPMHAWVRSAIPTSWQSTTWTRGSCSSRARFLTTTAPPSTTAPSTPTGSSSSPAAICPRCFYSASKRAT